MIAGGIGRNSISRFGTAARTGLRSLGRCRDQMGDEIGAGAAAGLDPRIGPNN